MASQVNKMELTDKDYLALTLIGEARDQPIEGIVGVASVIRNRVLSSDPNKNYKDICLSPKQFSCWNSDDPNSVLLQKLIVDIKNDTKLNDPSYKQCYAVADAVYNHEFKDNTHGAKNYVTKERYNLAHTRKAKEDEWIINMQPVVTLGAHIFLV